MTSLEATIKKSVSVCNIFILVFPENLKLGIFSVSRLQTHKAASNQIRSKLDSQEKLLGKMWAQQIFSFFVRPLNPESREYRNLCP